MESGAAEVQLTEIVAKREFLTRLTHEQWLDGSHGYSETPIYGPNELYGVDQGKRAAILIEMLQRKQKKFYAAPKMPLWLLIWTTDTVFCPFWVEGGVARHSDAVDGVRAYIESSGAAPFSEVWFTNLETRPRRIWSI